MTSALDSCAADESPCVDVGTVDADASLLTDTRTSIRCEPASSLDDAVDSLVAAPEESELADAKRDTDSTAISPADSCGALLYLRQVPQCTCSPLFAHQTAGGDESNERRAVREACAALAHPHLSPT